MNQRARISSAPKNPFSLGQKGLLALQQRLRKQRVARDMRQVITRSTRRTSRDGRHSFSRRPASRPAGGHCTKKRKIGPEPARDAQAVAQPKSKELDTAAGSKTDEGDKETSYTRNLLRKLVEVIKEVDAHKKAAETQSDIRGEDPAETEAIYSMYLQFNDILHKQQRP